MDPKANKQKSCSLAWPGRPPFEDCNEGTEWKGRETDMCRHIPTACPIRLQPHLFTRPGQQGPVHECMSQVANVLIRVLLHKRQRNLTSFVVFAPASKACKMGEAAWLHLRGLEWPQSVWPRPLNPCRSFPTVLVVPEMELPH